MPELTDWTELPVAGRPEASVTSVANVRVYAEFSTVSCIRTVPISSV